MKKSSGNQSPFLHGTFMIVCLLLHFSTIKSAQFVQYNYTFDLPEVKLNQLYLSRTNKQKIFQGQILKEFLIREPKQIGNVFQIEILPQNQSIKSEQLNDNVIEELNVTSLKGLWFESFHWPMKHKSYLYSLQKPALNSTQTTEEIISVTHSSPKHNSTDFNSSRIFPLYVLLSSGKIQVVQNEFQMLKSKKQYTYLSKTQTNTTNTTNTTTNALLWNDGYLYHKEGRLYLLVQEKLYTVSLTETDEDGQIKRFFTLQVIGLQNVRQVIEDGNDLYAFTQDAVYKIANDSFELAIKFTDVFETFHIADKRLIDVAIHSKNFYFLNHPLGIIRYSQLKTFSLLTIQHPELARKINVFQRTIFVTYQMGDDNYIQEYQFFPEGQKLYANKIFDYHSDEQVKEILVYQNHMIINRGPELILGMHSLNRNFPPTFHDKSQSITSFFFLDQIYELRSVGSSLIDTPAFLVVGPQYVQLFQFEPNPDQQMQQKWIKIGSDKTGIFEFDVKYTGTCKLNHFYPSEYCSIQNSIQLIVTDPVGEQIHSWWIWVCLAIAGLILSFMAWVLAWRHFSKKQNEFESLASTRRTKDNPSITLVQMQTQKENDEKTETN